MCLICVELAKNTLTSIEAKRNFAEMKSQIDEHHQSEVLQHIQMKEDEENIIDTYLKYEADTD